MMMHKNRRSVVLLLGGVLALAGAAAAPAWAQEPPVAQAGSAPAAADDAVAEAAEEGDDAVQESPAVQETPVAAAPAAVDPAVQEPGESEGDFFVQDEADVQDEYDQDESGPVSPSQISRDRINAIRSNDFFYQSYGKQDPFLVLVTGKYEQSASHELLDVNSGKLVGVMWGQDDQFALVEDGEGFGYILRVGDRVQNGRIVSIRKNSLTARVTLYGITNQVVLKLENTEG